MDGGLGNTTCYQAECTAIVEGVESDSLAAVTAANSLSMQWELLNRWKLCSRACSSLRVDHTWREANQPADIIAKRASWLVNNELSYFVTVDPHGYINGRCLMVCICDMYE
ncbi:hypothetical protein IFM89_002518 [Coptis chinensis]|uniref:RNase H type-1 domain-containing protein n=1 Tax=Coptis chinensis TaxID=261450 RepID=A0A835HIR5_9MAGN|nr:hypothetical protein IFM89_002518 [Coptis chinensis]